MARRARRQPGQGRAKSWRGSRTGTSPRRWSRRRRTSRSREANLEQGSAELTEAERALERSARAAREELRVAGRARHGGRPLRQGAGAAIAGFKAAIAVAQANHRAAQVAVEQTLIRAPFDGVVLTKNANVGDVITPFSSALGSQAAVVTMADMSTLEVEADVSEASVGKVRLEQPCEIQLDALPDARFRGVVQSHGADGRPRPRRP